MKAARRDRYNLARVLTFSQPVFLAILLLIPLSILIAWPRLAQRSVEIKWQRSTSGRCSKTPSVDASKLSSVELK